VPAHGDFGACEKCHLVEGWSPQRFSHDKTAFPLTGVHTGVACATCHAKFRKGEFKPGPNACILCHGDPHGGQFTGGHAAAPSTNERVLVAQAGRGVPASATHAVSPGRGCIECHTTRGWSPSTVDAVKHASFGYALVGQHATVVCARCHDAGRFIGTPTTCNRCHLDRHGGRFGSDCARCHDPRSWRGVPNFDHAQTGFQLVASHTRVACAECHGADRQRLVGKRDIGCATCHTPRHGDQFGSECTRCHQPTRFSDVPSFDHSRTMFPLDRRHSVVRCTSCHDVSRAARLDTRCRTCHGDPHHGRTFIDCGECHSADVWRIVRFDHDRTEFPLRGRHFVTPCNECHTNDQFTGVRSECISCHRGDRARADQLHNDHRAFPFDCGQCHRPFNW